MAYVDSHAHLDDSRFEPDRKEVLARARAASLQCVLTVGLGTKRAEFARTLELCEHHGFLWAALGLHPHEARHMEAGTLDILEKLVQHPRVLAWGEIGLDYHYDHSPQGKQQEAFRAQLQSARRLKLPIVVHCREAWDDCLQILSEEWASSGLGGILHCFSGNAEVADKALAWGFLISFAGNVTFPRAQELREVARMLPRECLLIETDCPYLAPQPFRGKRNEPAYVVEVAGELAKLHNTSKEELGAQCSENFFRMFPRAVGESGMQ